MKRIKAQTSLDILQNIFPLSAVDNKREVLDSKEATVLYDLWKSGKNIDGKVIAPLEFDRLVMASLKTKGYLKSNGLMVEFTKRAKEVIKKFILDKEKNTFKES